MIASTKPRVCHCAPATCGAPRPEWCVGKRAVEWRARLTGALMRAEFEEPGLAAPDGTVAVLIHDLRAVLAEAAAPLPDREA